MRYKNEVERGFCHGARSVLLGPYALDIPIYDLQSPAYDRGWGLGVASAKSAMDSGVPSPDFPYCYGYDGYGGQW